MINWPDDSIVNEEIRARIFELLNNGSSTALKEIEVILGWKSNGMCMPFSLIARKIGITPSKIYYILNHKHQNEKDKLRRIAKRKANNIDFVRYHSEILHFSINLPHSWSVIQDSMINPLNGEDPDKIINQINREMPEDIRTNTVIPIIFFTRINIINLVQLASMTNAIFRSSSGNVKDDPAVEIALLYFSKPMTAMDIYELSKPPHHFVPTGSRPKNGIIVDGMEGVKYYYTFIEKDKNRDQVYQKFLNIYLTEKMRGWIISCSSLYDQFLINRPLFDKVIISFIRDKFLITAQPVAAGDLAKAPRPNAEIRF
ncbi:MAG: hypothetical protein ABSB78_14220 [Bacteroidota bacterium]